MAFNMFQHQHMETWRKSNDSKMETLGENQKVNLDLEVWYDSVGSVVP